MARGNRTMKPEVILISGKDPLRGVGGFEVHAGNIAKIISGLGYKVHIVCAGKTSSVRTTSIGTIHTIGSWVFSFPPLQTVEMAGLLFMIPRLRSKIRTLVNRKRSLIWGIGAWTLAGVRMGSPLIANYFGSILRESRATKKELTPSIHGILPVFESHFAAISVIPIYHLLEKYLLRNADRVVTHYASTERVLREYLGVSKSRIERIPYPVDLFLRYNKKDISSAKIPSKPLILFVGRHEARKGIHHLLKAFAILKNRKVRFNAVILGHGKLLLAHRKFAKNLHLKNVLIPGAFPGPRPFWKQATLFVCPSIEEGSSVLVILEAMKYGLPIVATNIDGIPEDIKNNKSGLLVDPNDPIALANAMETVLTHPSQAKKFGIQARNAYHKKYDTTRVTKAVSTLLRGLS